MPRIPRSDVDPLHTLLNVPRTAQAAGAAQLHVAARRYRDEIYPVPSFKDVNVDVV